MYHPLCDTYHHRDDFVSIRYKTNQAHVPRPILAILCNCLAGLETNIV